MRFILGLKISGAGWSTSVYFFVFDCFTIGMRSPSAKPEANARKAHSVRRPAKQS